MHQKITLILRDGNQAIKDLRLNTRNMVLGTEKVSKASLKVMVFPKYTVEKQPSHRSMYRECDRVSIEPMQATAGSAAIKYIMEFMVLCLTVQ